MCGQEEISGDRLGSGQFTVQEMCLFFSLLLITEETIDYKEIKILCLKSLQVL